MEDYTKSIEKTAKRFVEIFREVYAEDATKYKHKYDPVLTEMSDDDIIEIITKYFTEYTGLTEANDYFYKAYNKFIPDTWDQIDHSLDREVMEQTQAYKQWRHHGDVHSAWYETFRKLELDQMFCVIHGKRRTNEEAAKLAADKWCELLFGWHLQDNGALNETHPGGFQACALGTVLANSAKEKITDEMKRKAHELFVQYYLHDIEFQNGNRREAVEWARKTLPDPGDKNPYVWSAHSFIGTNMYCDYNPYMPLYLVLINAGIPDYEACKICPWKTGISIRALDNTVEYHTCQHREEL